MNIEDYGEGVSFSQDLGDREIQQDDFGCLIANNFIFTVLADGMGGHKGGETASELVVECFLSSANNFDDNAESVIYNLATSLLNANKIIASYGNDNFEKTGLGSTVIAFYLYRGSVYWLSVGDSHLYRYRNNKLVKLNADHSMKPIITELLEQGKITTEQADKHPLRNRLRSAITGNDIELLDCPDSPEKFIKDDIYILSSDGLDVLPIITLEKIISKNRKKNSIEINRSIMKATLKQEFKGRDNTTVVIIKPTF